MIVSENFIVDWSIHTIMIMLINVYIIIASSLSGVVGILVFSMLMSVIVTWISHTYLKKYTLRKVLKKLE
jgi:hypothetical protein